MGCASLFQINRFFCCASLKIGSLIIGYIGLLANVLATAAGSSQLQYFQAFTLNLNAIGNYTITGTDFLISEYMAMGIAYHAVSIFFQLALLWGIHKTKHEFVLPWLIVKGFECVFAIGAIVVITIVYALSPGVGVGGIFLLIAVFIVAIWLSLYLYSCVYSYYLVLKAAPALENEKEYPPAYLPSFITEKKHNISDITHNQEAV